MSDLFDFGFTAVNEDELSAVTVDELQSRLDKLYKAMIPLLNNLKKNPDKDYILWPDRLKKVEEFESHLRKIYEGN
jgi:hypothetical protein